MKQPNTFLTWVASGAFVASAACGGMNASQDSGDASNTSGAGASGGAGPATTTTQATGGAVNSQTTDVGTTGGAVGTGGAGTGGRVGAGGAGIPGPGGFDGGRSDTSVCPGPGRGDGGSSSSEMEVQCYPEVVGPSGRPSCLPPGDPEVLPRVQQLISSCGFAVEFVIDAADDVPVADDCGDSGTSDGSTDDAATGTKRALCCYRTCGSHICT